MVEEGEISRLGIHLRDGTPWAWERLYLLVHLPILRMLRRFVRDAALAEEALQAAFVTAIERIDSFDPSKGTPDGWLWGIARNKAREMARRPAPAPLDADPPDPAASAADAAAPDGERIALALDGLEPRYAEVLRRKYLAEQSLEEIARDLGLKVATVGTLLHRGRERFRRAYDRLAPEPEKRDAPGANRG